MKAILVLAVMVALTGLARAADEKVEITGSHIKQKVHRFGSVTDTVAPVFVLDRARIDRTGAFTVADALRGISFARVQGR